MNLTLSFEANHVANLQNFVAWMGSFKTEVKRELEQSEEDSVRIMTVHGSKGLQAPIVVLPDTLREPYLRRQRGALLKKIWFIFRFLPMIIIKIAKMFMRMRRKKVMMNIEGFCMLR